MKDYHDMLSSLKDKVVGAAGKATVAVADAAGKVSETVTDAANKVVSDEMRDKVAGAAHAVGDRATMEHGGLDYMNFVAIVLRKK